MALSVQDLKKYKPGNVANNVIRIFSLVEAGHLSIYIKRLRKDLWDILVTINNHFFSTQCASTVLRLFPCIMAKVGMIAKKR